MNYVLMTDENTVISVVNHSVMLFPDNFGKIRAKIAIIALAVESDHSFVQ